MSYIDSFLFRDRLHDVLAWALTEGRLADVEADQIEAAIGAEPWAAYDAGWRQGRMALALRHPELGELDAVEEAYRRGLWEGLAIKVHEADQARGAA